VFSLSKLNQGCTCLFLWQDLYLNLFHIDQQHLLLLFEYDRPKYIKKKYRFQTALRLLSLLVKIYSKKLIIGFFKVFIPFLINPSSSKFIYLKKTEAGPLRAQLLAGQLGATDIT
jgi:hypothetical protein